MRAFMKRLTRLHQAENLDEAAAEHVVQVAIDNDFNTSILNLCSDKRPYMEVFLEIANNMVGNADLVDESEADYFEWNIRNEADYKTQLGCFSQKVRMTVHGSEDQKDIGVRHEILSLLPRPIKAIVKRTETKIRNQFIQNKIEGEYLMVGTDLLNAIFEAFLQNHALFKQHMNELNERSRANKGKGSNIYADRRNLQVNAMFVDPESDHELGFPAAVNAVEKASAGTQPLQEIRNDFQALRNELRSQNEGAQRTDRSNDFKLTAGQAAHLVKAVMQPQRKEKRGSANKRKGRENANAVHQAPPPPHHAHQQPNQQYRYAPPQAPAVYPKRSDVQPRSDRGPSKRSAPVYISANSPYFAEAAAFVGKELEDKGFPSLNHAFEYTVNTYQDRVINAYPPIHFAALKKGRTDRVSVVDQVNYVGGGRIELKYRPFVGAWYTPVGQKGQYALHEQCITWFTTHCPKCGVQGCHPMNPDCPYHAENPAFTPCMKCKTAFHPTAKCITEVKTYHVPK